MLKISIKDGRTRRLLILEGKIIAPWTEELTRVACQDDANHIASRDLVIDHTKLTARAIAELQKACPQLGISRLLCLGANTFCLRSCRPCGKMGTQTIRRQP